MDGKGRATDNAFIECWFRTLKHRHIYLNPADDARQLCAGVAGFVPNATAAGTKASAGANPSICTTCRMISTNSGYAVVQPMGSMSYYRA